MNFKEFEKTRERKQIQLLAVSALVFYWPWYFVSTLISNDLIDDIWGRGIISLLCGLIFVYSRKSNVKHKQLRTLFHCGLYLIAAHQVYLLSINNWNHYYQMAYVLAFLILATSVLQFSHFLYFAAFSLIAPILSLPFSHPPIAEVTYFYLIDVTLMYFVGQTLRANFSSRQEIAVLGSANQKSSKLAALGQMAAGVAHEINSPLSIIKGKSDQILMRTISDAPIDRMWLRTELAKIGNTVERISRITRGMRDFSRSSEQDQMTLVTLQTWIENTLELCSERMKHHSVQFEMGSIPHVSVLGRESQLVQVLLNLINNSVDALESSEIRKINLDFKIVDTNLQILVTDSGPGIKSEHQSKLTEPFFTTKPPGKGTGLGLSISRGIMESHAGHLAHVTESKKTCFMIEIPLAEESYKFIQDKKSA